MRYIQANNGVFVRHIYNEFESIQWDENNKTSVKKLTEDKRAAFGVYPLKMVSPSAFDKIVEVRLEGDAVLIENAWTQNWLLSDKFADTIQDGVTTTRAEHETAYAAKLATEAQSAAQSASKLAGVMIEGQLRSATGKDQNGMVALGMLKLKVDALGLPFPSTLMRFENGNHLVITAANYDEVEAIWTQFRGQFFAA
jgi:hypothetical protein